MRGSKTAREYGVCLTGGRNGWKGKRGNHEGEGDVDED